MAMIKCSECGKEISDRAAECVNCGNPINIKDSAPSPTSAYRGCPKCGSGSVTYQREQNFSASGGTQTMKWKPANGNHGCLYWLFIGWWIWFLKLMFHVCTLGIFLIFGKKKQGKWVGKSATVNKSFNRTMAVCQSCGYSWTV